MNRYLIIQTAFLGDTLLTLPMVQSLAKLHPHSLIDIVTLPANMEVFKLSPHINEVIPYDKRGAEKGILGVLKLARKITRAGYSKVFVPHRSARSSMLAYFSRVPSISFDKSALSFLYDELVEYDGATHEVERNLRLLTNNTEQWRDEPLLTFDAIDKSKIDDIIGESKQVIAIAQGSVWETKKYPLNNYIRVADALIERGFTIAIIGSKSEIQDTNTILKKLPEESVIDVAGRLSISESVYFLSRCTALISNDSAPTHMGVMAGIPVLTIYCSTIPEFGFFPYNRGSKFLSFNGLECKPCGIHGRKECPLGTFECAVKIEPSEVLAEVLSMVNKKANEFSSDN